MRPARSSSSSSKSFCTEQSQQLACRATTGDEQAQERLLLLFEPLLCNCARRAAVMLPHEERAVLLAEARYAFFLLLREFDPDQGVPLAGYLKSKIWFHLFNWCRAEQKRFQRAVFFDEDAFERAVCVEWQCEKAKTISRKEWLKREVEHLPERQKLVMQLVGQGLSEREIGAQLGISGVRVNQIKAQAKAALLKKFEFFLQSS